MRSLFIILGIFFLLAAVAYGVKTYIGDIRPAVLPSSGSIVQKFEESKNQNSAAGEIVTIPLQVSKGYKVGLFGKNLGKARGMAFSPEGVLLVSNMSGRGKIMAMPDKNNDGIADSYETVAEGLNNTHGFAFYGGKLFITEETAVSRYHWDGQNLKATFDKKLFDLPDPGGHFTRTIVFDKQGQMFVSLGSTCNVCIEKNPFFAAVIVSDAEGKTPQVFAKGLRNSVAMAFESESGILWGAENGRDLLGDGIPPEEVNILQQGKDYGWPYCYGNKVADTSFSADSVNHCPATEPMVFGLNAHNAPLGMAFVPDAFSTEWKGDIVVALHGSWNRSTPDGYKVVRLNKEGNQILGSEDLLSGFIQGKNAEGRPVDVIFNQAGNLFVSDDKAGAIYIVSKQ